MRTTDLLSIDTMPLLVPDVDLVYSEEDLLCSDSGLDESGVYHRYVLRRGVKSWDFSYSQLTNQEYAYMEALFFGKDTFLFQYKSAFDDTWQTVKAYRSKHSVRWHNAADGQFRDYCFRITTC